MTAHKIIAVEIRLKELHHRFMAECSITAGIHLIVAQRLVTKNNAYPCALCFHLTSAIEPPSRKTQLRRRQLWLTLLPAVLPTAHISKLPLKLHALILTHATPAAFYGRGGFPPNV